MIKRKTLRTISVIMCVFMLFSGVSIPVSGYHAQPDASVKRITLYRQSGVLEGESLQLRVNIESDSTLFDGVEWSSSNPSVISCTADGIITGNIVGESATITCKARYGSAKDSVEVICVKKLENSIKSGFKNVFTSIYHDPYSGLMKDFCFDFTVIKNPFFQAIRTIFYLFNMVSTVNSVIDSNVTVCGKAGSYAYIRYGENNSLDGFVKFSSLKNTGNAFLTLSATNMCVYADGVEYDSRKLTTNYNGKVTWTVEHEDKYLKFVRETGQITGLVPGQKAVITATADGETATCTIHLLYKWPQNWTGKTNRETYIYYADGNNYSKGVSLEQNTEFVVEGDCGTNSGWAYGYIKGTNNWGFIPISHLSTKGTVSQYNNLGWTYPIQNTKFKNISSVYGWRSGNRHLGFDINKGDYSTISGENVVAPSNGKVVFVNKRYDYSTKKPDYGYCIIIATDSVDFISGNKLYVVYMHLDEPPTLNSGDEVTPGEVIGKVGTTGNSTGPHLHLEINNKGTNFAGSGNSDSFDKTINPIFFYLNYGLKDDSDSSKDEYWYNDDK